MSQYCRYHALEVAEWHCPNCLIDFCATCSPDPADDESASAHKCPHCKATLLALAGSRNAPPFWQRLTDFLRYPISPVAGAMLLLAFVLPLVVPQGVSLHVARLAFLIGACYYLWTAFEAVAAGNLVPLGPRDLVEVPAKPIPPRLGVLLALLAAGVGYLQFRQYFVGTMVAVLVVGFLPAALISVGVTRSVGSGFSKEGLTTVLRGVGPVYAAVFLLPVILLAVLNSFVGLFADVLPVAIGDALALTAHTYFAIVLFTLSGYVLFQFQEALDYTPEGAAALRRKHYKKGDPVQIQTEMFLKDGSYGKAVALLKADVDKKMSTLSQHERYHRLIWAMNSEQELRAHAAPYFKLLLQAGRGIQAASLFRAYCQRFPDFKVTEPEVRFELAQTFEEQGDYKLAVHVLNGLHKDHPHYPGLPDAYLLAARLLADRLALPQKAAALVEFLHGRYRNHRAFAEITALRTTLAQQLAEGGSR
jgi:hypothetical protein